MQTLTNTPSLGGGFTEAPQQSARAFRAVMNAMARPGVIETLDIAAPPAPLSVAAGTLALTLLDHNTPVYLAGKWDCAAVRDWLTFHTSAPFSSAEEADFAFGDWDALHLSAPTALASNTPTAAPRWWWKCPHCPTPAPR